MSSTVYWTVLGVVIERPSYGHEVYNRYERVYGEMLPVSGASHVYTALNTLTARDLIEAISAIDGINRQPKPHYRATALGVRSYAEWLVKQVDVQSRQQELWVRQLSLFAHDPDAALGLLERYQREYQRAAARPGHPPRGVGTNTRGELINDLAAEQQRIAVGGMLSWLGYAKARFKALAEGAARDDPPRA